MKKFNNIIAILNLILGILNICRFLYYSGHFYVFLWNNLLIGIWCIWIGIKIYEK
jgi:hypothetical protein